LKSLKIGVGLVWMVKGWWLGGEASLKIRERGP